MGEVSRIGQGLTSHSNLDEQQEVEAAILLAVDIWLILLSKLDMVIKGLSAKLLGCGGGGIAAGCQGHGV